MEVRHREAVDRLLREANVFRLRRQWAQAEEKCRAALAVAPEDVGARELLGDLLRERDQMEAALEQYRRALEQAPGRPTLEKKFAEVTLELAERQHLCELAQRALDQPEALRKQGPKRSQGMALLFALIWPGLGQFYVAQAVTLKGLILAGAALLCLPGLESLSKILLVLAGYPRVSGVGGAAVLGLVFFFVWVYGIGDAVTQAQRSAASPAERPGL